MSAVLDELTILVPALAAGVVVLATHVPLGQQVLARGIIFIDLAIAQIAGLGVIAAYSLGGSPGGWPVQAVAFSAAFTGAAALYYLERTLPDLQEAIIGSAFVLAASGAILLLAASPHAGEELKELLAGQILWVRPAPLAGAALLSVLLLWLWFRAARRHALVFYLVFAAAVTASVQLVGLYLVFASLIFPALATWRLHGRRALWTGYVVGAAGYVLGVVLSVVTDLPTGAVIVWTLAAVAAVSAAVRPARE